jgi:hypothetical protein
MTLTFGVVVVVVANDTDGADVIKVKRPVSVA